VIKYGGSLLEKPGHRAAFLKEVGALSSKEKVVLVHGGGGEITRQMEKAGFPSTFVEGRRMTDDRAMGIIEKALGDLNREIVRDLNAAGARAMGFSGQKDHLMEAVPIPELGRVGYPRCVDQDVLQRIL